MVMICPTNRPFAIMSAPEKKRQIVITALEKRLSGLGFLLGLERFISQTDSSPKSCNMQRPNCL